MNQSVVVTPLIVAIFIIVALFHTVIAQAAPSQIIGEKYPRSVNVVYQSPNTVILQGDLIIKAGLLSYPDPESLASYANLFNTDLWAAMDLLKSSSSFQLQEIMTSGVGSVGNPSTVFIVLTK